MLFVYIHIPKCAGDGFYQALRRYPGVSNALSFFPSLMELSHASFGCMANGAAGTHCGVSEIGTCLSTGAARLSGPAYQLPRPVAPLYVAILREPVQRSISEYFWWRPHCEAKAKLATWDVFFPWPQELCMLNLSEWARHPINPAPNRMTKALVDLPAMGRGIPGHKRACVTMAALDAAVFWQGYYSAPTLGAAYERLNQDNALLDNALLTLSTRFAFLALTEELERSVQLFGWLQGLPARHVSTNGAFSHSSKLEQSKTNSSSTPDLFELTRRNRLDGILYTHARASFEQAAASAGL